MPTPFQPASTAELRDRLRGWHAARRRAGPVCLSALAAVVNYQPEDMTVRVQSGLRLAELQRALAARGQWLPVDPPAPEQVTIEALLDHNLHGPRLYGYGGVREHLIGMKMALADGREIESGGNVVKNVAGYDVQKLFIGARRSLGLITEAVFKLRPLPEQTAACATACHSAAEAARLTREILASALVPVALDWWRGEHGGEIQVVVLLDGTRDEIASQLQSAAALGLDPVTAANHDEELSWDQQFLSSVIPGRLAELVNRLDGLPFVARAGNGLVRHACAALREPARVHAGLSRRLKTMFDPHGVFPNPPWLS